MANQTTKVVKHKSANDLEPDVKKTSIETLNSCLAGGLDVALMVKQAHWNLRGPNFMAVHEQLDDIREILDEGNDEMAERISQLGGTALGTSQVIVKATTIEAYPLDIVKVEDHLKALIERLGACGNAVREAIDIVEEAGDADTADIFTEISRDVDKKLWFLESHFVNVPADLTN